MRKGLDDGDVFVWDADSGLAITKGDFDAAAEALVDGLRSSGVGEGDAVAVLMENRVEFLLALTAAEIGGLTVIPVNRHLRADEVVYILNDSGARGLITSGRHAAILEQLPEAAPACEVLLVAGDEDAHGARSLSRLIEQSWGARTDPPVQGKLMMYSSGTTGRPKGIVRQGGVSKFAVSVRDLLSMDENTRQMVPAPLYHAGPILMVSAIKSCGGKLVLMERFDARACLEVLERYRVTHGYWVPTMFVRMLKLPEEERLAFDVSCQIAALHVGGPCPKDVKLKMFDWWGPIIHEVYGGSEGMGMTYASPEDWLAHPGTVGYPDDCEIHVCDESGAELAPGEVGLVYFDSGEVVFTYHNDPDKVESTKHPLHRNWTSYGDMGWMDEDGFLYLSDRRTDMVVTGGVNVYTREVEEALLTHPEIRDACVFGVPDEEYGQSVIAVIERNPEHAGERTSLEDIGADLRAKIAGYKCPRDLVEMDQLPRLPTGKLRKHELREHYLRARRDAPDAPELPSLTVVH